MENTFPSTDFNPEAVKNMSPECAAAYMSGFRDGVKKERDNHKRPPMEKIFPEYYEQKEINQNGKQKIKKHRSWMMTEELLKARDEEIRNDLIVDIYCLVNEHIIERYKLCYFAALIPALSAEGFGQKRMDRVTKNLEGQLIELARYVKRRDDRAIAKWCQRHDVDQSIMQQIFLTNAEYRFEQDFGIDDLDIFLTEDKK